MTFAKPLSLTLFAPLILAACAIAPPPPVPFTAYPGPGRTPEAFRQDDTACRQQSGTAAPQATPQSAAQPGGTAAQGEAATVAIPGHVLVSEPQQAAQAEAYLQCMATRGNTVAPIAGAAGPLPIPYAAYPYPYPGVWADPFAYSHYGSPWGWSVGPRLGWYGGLGWYGSRRWYGGYRGGWHGGYRGGGGRGRR
jgi:hypothetical protein